MDIRQIKAIEAANKKKILRVCPTAADMSGIYIMNREENGFKYCYVGQAKHVLSRLAQHLNGYQHIDLSLKKHKLYREDNKTGWQIGVIYCPIDKLDEYEQKYILMYANAGYQMRNKTSGSQGKGKENLDVDVHRKGYRDGIKQGYNNARREVSRLFEKHLNYEKKSKKPNKNQDKALQKFESFIDLTVLKEDEDEEENCERNGA